MHANLTKFETEISLLFLENVTSVEVMNRTLPDRGYKVS